VFCHRVTRLALLALHLVALHLVALCIAPAAHAADAPTTRAQLARHMAQAGGGSGALVVDLDTGRRLFAARPDVPRTPASVQKLYTTATALLRFGTEATLRTQALATAPIDERGVLAGDLYLRGAGDPTFGPAQARALAEGLAAAGLTDLRGRVQGDESSFDARRGPPSSAYRTSIWVGPLSALSYARGRTGLRAPWFQASPPRFAAAAFTAALRRAGVRVRRAAGVAAAPAEAVVLAERPSPRMAELVRLVNVPSDNYASELLLKALGRAFGPEGSTGGGSIVVRTALADLGVRPRVVDGSGLARANATSPRDVVRLLAALAGAEAGPAFEASLAVAGRTGTLRSRLRASPARDRCRGKTGSLNGVSALAGYCTTTGGSRVAFAYLMNGVSVSGARRLQDAMTTILARYSPAPVPLAARSRSSAPSSSASSPASSSTGTPRRSAFSSLEPAASPATR